MINKKYKVIFWDFDGVLMRSNEIRDMGFIKVLSSYPESDVDKLMDFHKKNGGLSRYLKFRYFFETIRSESITEEFVNELAEQFSKIMLDLLIDPDLIIQENIEYIKLHYLEKDMHIVSGSAQKELRIICNELGIAKFFKSINGSPTHKDDLVKSILKKFGYRIEGCILIGDSMNDYNAAIRNNISFKGYDFDESSIYTQ